MTTVQSQTHTTTLQCHNFILYSILQLLGSHMKRYHCKATVTRIHIILFCVCISKSVRHKPQNGNRTGDTRNFWGETGIIVMIAINTVSVSEIRGKFQQTDSLYRQASFVNLGAKSQLQFVSNRSDRLLLAIITATYVSEE